MRYKDFKLKEEGTKSSNVVRYNTELAMLASFAGATGLNSIPDDSLANPEANKKRN